MNTKIFVFGQKYYTSYDKAYIEFEFNKIVSKLKLETNLFIYSGLQEGADLDFAYWSIKKNIPTVGYIPFKNFHFKFTPYNQKIYRFVVNHLHSFHIVSRVCTYKAYSTRTNIISHDCNGAVVTWNGYKGPTKILLDTLVFRWRDRKNPIYIINQKVHTISLINT